MTSSQIGCCRQKQIFLKSIIFKSYVHFHPLKWWVIWLLFRMHSNPNCYSRYLAAIKPNKQKSTTVHSLLIFKKRHNFSARSKINSNQLLLKVKNFTKDDNIDYWIDIWLAFLFILKNKWTHRLQLLWHMPNSLNSIYTYLHTKKKCRIKFVIRSLPSFASNL